MTSSVLKIVNEQSNWNHVSKYQRIEKLHKNTEKCESKDHLCPLIILSLEQTASGLRLSKLIKNSRQCFFVHGLKISCKSKTGGCFKARLTGQRANFFCVSKNGVSNLGRDRFQLGMNDVWTGSWYSILLPLVYLVSSHLKENQCIRPQAYSCTSMAKFFTINCIFFIFRKK